MRKNTFARQTAKTILPGALAVILFAVFIFGLVLPSFREHMLDRKKEMLHELTALAWNIAAYQQSREQSGELSRPQAQELAKRQIERLNYGEDHRNYFWITDLRPVMVMHPYRPDLHGQDLARLTDPHGTRLFQEMVRMVEERGEGYVSYLWQWKDNPERVVPKISYVKRFTPWAWIIGTGVYLDDMERQLASISRRLVSATLAVLAAVAVLSASLVGQALRSETKKEEAEAELRRHRDHLDLLVRQRTGELTRANLQLGQEVREKEEARLKLAASEEKFKDLLDNANDLVQSVRSDGSFLYVNRAWQEALGYDEQEIAKLTVFEVIHPSCREQCFAHFKEILAGKEAGRLEACFQTKSGGRLVVEGSVSCKFIEGQPQFTRGIFRDITSRKLAEEKIRDQNLFLFAVLESLPFPFYVVNVQDHTIALANSSTSSEGIGADAKCYEITHRRQSPCSSDHHACPLERVQATREPTVVEHRHYDQDGRERYFEVHGYPLFTEGGELVQMIEVALDITERKRLQEKLREQSISDELTGLLNRRGFLSMAEQQLRIAAREGKGLFLVYADLDGLKWLNDTLGHQAGDRALAETAAILKGTFRKADLIARLGGDEFVVLAMEGACKSTGKTLLRRLQHTIRETNAQQHLAFEISLSIGVAEYDPLQPRPLEELMAEADSRMYAAKKNREAS